MPQPFGLRLLLALLMLAVTTSSSFAQDYVIRIDDAEMVMPMPFAALVRGLHVIAPGEKEIQEIVLFSALIVDDEVLEVGRSPFLAAPIDEWEYEVHEGLTLRDAGIELGSEYRERRAEMSIDADLFVPTNLVGDDAEVPGDKFIPGDKFLPGDMLDPEDEFAAEREEGTMVPPQQFVGGVTKLSSSNPNVEKLIKIAYGMEPEAYKAGEPFLIFFATNPNADISETEVVGLLRASWRR